MPELIVGRLNSTRRQAIRNSLPQVCVTCGTTHNLTLDHIVARTLGGTNARENFQILCKGCNYRKAQFEVEELRKRRRAAVKQAKANFYRDKAQREREATTPATNYGGRAFSQP